MNNKNYFAALFTLMCCMPLLAWPLVKGAFDTGNYENRNLAEKPEFTAENYKTYAEKYEDYFDDHLPFRNELIRTNNVLQHLVFKKENDKVVVGGNNWLFYKEEGQSDPISLYQGKDLYSPEKLEDFKAMLTKNRDFLARQGIDFAVFIAPNKERIYSEYMPLKYGRPAPDYRAKQLVDYLKENTDIKVIYPYERLMEAKDKTPHPIYYKEDTHWNKLGAYVGVRELVKAFGIDLPDINRPEVTVEETVGGGHDLSMMLNLDFYFKDKLEEYTVKGYTENTPEQVAHDLWSVLEYHTQNADDRTLFMYRDSFGENMADYLATQFKDTHIVHLSDFTTRYMLETKPDIFVIQLVERDSHQLARFDLTEE